MACSDTGIDCELIVPPKVKNGCERCKKKRISCSYRNGGSKGVDACEACEGAEVTCYAAPLNDSASSGRCDDFVDDFGEVRSNITCAIRTYTPRKTIAPPAVVCAPRVYVSCNQCRMEGLKCSVKRDQPGPCSQCRKKNQSCKFVLIRFAKESTPSKTSSVLKLKQTSKSGKGKPTASSDISRLHSPASPQPHSPSGMQQTLAEESWYRGTGRSRRATHGTRLKKKTSRAKKKTKRTRCRTTILRSPTSSPQIIGKSDGYTHIKITTSFSHPIKFNFVPSPDGTYQCSWCKEDNTFFGLYGFGSKAVEVIPYPQGYEEIGEGKYRGWGQMGKEATNMCQSCTNIRMSMIACADHRMALIEDQNPALFGEKSAWTRALGALAIGDLESGWLILNAKFCSICTSVAEYRCMALQDSTSWEHGGSKYGCGLLLCELCNDLLSHITKSKEELEKWEEKVINVLDRLIEMVEKGDGGGVDCNLRADASFLKSVNGELLMHLLPPNYDSETQDTTDSKNVSDDSDNDVDAERSRIYERIGKGRGKWNNKHRPNLASSYMMRGPGSGDLMIFDASGKSSMLIENED
jgi:hypothetical protein